MNEKRNEMWNVLCDLDGETVVRLLTDYHGMQLLDDGFYDHLIDEGYIDEPEHEPEPDDDINNFDDFDEFCSQYTTCGLCPLYERDKDCETKFNEHKED